MIIDQIDVECVPLLEAESHFPVCPDIHTSKTFEGSLKGMKPETGQIHLFGLSGTAEDGQDIFNLFELIGMDAFCLAPLEKPFEPPVPKVLNHKTRLQ